MYTCNHDLPPQALSISKEELWNKPGSYLSIGNSDIGATLLEYSSSSLYASYDGERISAGIAHAGLMRSASYPRLGMEIGEIYDGHILHDTTKNEVTPCRLKSRKPYKEAQEMVSGVRSIRTHPSTSPHIGPGGRCQGGRSVLRTMDDSKQTANWGRSLKLIYEEVRSDRQCSMWVCEPEQTADHIISYVDHHPKLMPSKLDPHTRARLQQRVDNMIWCHTEEEVGLEEWIEQQPECYFHGLVFIAVVNTSTAIILDMMPTTYIHKPPIPTQVL